MTIYSLDVLLSQFCTTPCSMSRYNCCFLTCIQISQEAGKVVQYSHLFKREGRLRWGHKGGAPMMELEVFQKAILSPNISSYANAQWSRTLAKHSSLEKRKVYCRAMRGNRWLKQGVWLKPQAPWKLSAKPFYKKGEGWGVVTCYKHLGVRPFVLKVRSWSVTTLL